MKAPESGSVRSAAPKSKSARSAAPRSKSPPGAAPKSNKQRSAELKARRRARDQKAAAKRKADRLAFIAAIGPPDGSALVNREQLAPYIGYGIPAFVTRGYYVNEPFVCKDCGKPEVWTATQQKWWYEVVKGHADTRAVRCRPCRRKERERAADHKRRTEEGRARKSALKAAGKWRTGR